MNIKDLYEKFIECSQKISTDTRTNISGSLFFAWKGDLTDGNNYIKKAFENGAEYVVCDNPGDAVSEKCIVVENTIKTLQDLARYHRSLFNIPIIAIGGSNGKTTTKELLASVLKQEKEIISSFGSLNNHTGVPLTLLRISGSTDIAIIEMGANHVGEIAELCTIALPTHGVVTNIGRDHIGLFGSSDAILTANLELYYYLKNNNGYIFVNKNDIDLGKYLGDTRHLFYGVGLLGENGITSLQTIPYVSGQWKSHTIKTHLTGEYNLENIITAIAIAGYFDITDARIITGISEYKSTNNRSEILQTSKDTIVIKDFYNANRTSMELSLNNLAEISRRYPDHQSIAILGDMLELGNYSSTEHTAVLDHAKTIGIQEIITIGPEFSQINISSQNNYKDVDDAIEKISSRNFEKKCILLKASNGTNLEKLFNAIDW